MSKHSGDRPQLTDDEKQLFAKWWEWSVMGMTVPKIVQREEKSGQVYSPAEVHHGMERFAEWCADPSARGDRLQRALDSVNGYRAIAYQQISRVMQQFADSGGKGIPREKIKKKTDGSGNIKEVVEEVTYQDITEVLLPVMNYLLSCDKYAAQLGGLMSGVDEMDQVEHIEIDIGGFLEDAYFEPPALDAPEDSTSVEDNTPTKRNSNPEPKDTTFVVDATVSAKRKAEAEDND